MGKPSGIRWIFVLVVDSFTLPMGAPHPENAKNWLKILGSKEAQEAFNPLKGSIPARTDVNRDIFSPYHQWSMDSFAKDALVPSCAHGKQRHQLSSRRSTMLQRRS